MLGDHVLEHIGQPHALQRRPHHQAHIAQGQRAVHFDFRSQAAAFELPAVQVAAGETMADAGQAMEVLGFVWQRMALEEGGRRHHHRTHVGADGQGHHVRFQPLAEAHAGVETAGHHVHQGVVAGDFQGHVRKDLEESGGQGQQNQLRRGAPGVDAQGAGRCVTELVEVIQGVVDIAKGRPDAGVEALAGFGQGHAAGGAIEQPYSQAFLQGPQCVAQG
ncbi:hypothetical protein D3C84_573200 [compost metagenome]